MKKPIKITILTLIPLLVLLTVFSVSCPWTNPFHSGEDLIAGLDLSTDWSIEEGLLLNTTSDTPPSGETGVYYLSFVNLVSYDTFEGSAGPADIGTWQKSVDILSQQDVPTVCTVKSDGLMYGTKYLHLKLERGDGAEFIYHTFPALQDKNYIFRFDFNRQPGSADILVSVGENTDDTTDIVINAAESVISTAQFDFFSMTSSASRQIRFGLADIGNPNGANFEIYVDNIALFLRSNHNICKQLNLIDADITNPTDDSTGQIFYEGLYKLQIWAKKDTSAILTLRLGNTYKEFSLTDSWKEYILEAQILNDYDYLIMEIMPTTVIESQRFPGGIFITTPHLFYLPNQAEPVQH